MDLEDTEKFLARIRQREEEIGKENCFSDSILSASGDVDAKDEVVAENSDEVDTESEAKSLYPVAQLKRLSEEAFKETTDEAPRAAPVTSSGSTDSSNRRSLFADLAANIDNYEVDLRPRTKITKSRKSASRLSCGETRASALFTPNANYYAPLTVKSSPKKQVSSHLEPVTEDISMTEDVRSKVASIRDVLGTEEKPEEAKKKQNSAQVQDPTRLCTKEDNVEILSSGDSGDEDKHQLGPLESTTLQGSPFTTVDKGDGQAATIRKFFEKKPEEYSSPCPSYGSKFYEPSPIPKASSKFHSSTKGDVFMRFGDSNEFREKRGDIVDELTAAANNATKDLSDLPATSGRAKQIALELEEKAKREVIVPHSDSPAKSAAPSRKKVGPSSNVHIHYRLNIPNAANVPKVLPPIDTTSANVKSLRNRWEVSSSTGAPLHPDQGEDDLLAAARKMSRDVKQAREQRMRPQSYYESRDPGEVQSERNINTSACNLRTLSTGSISSEEMEEEEKPAIVIEAPMEDEKCKKRGSSSADEEDGDGTSTGEKRMKREEKDETKLSGQMIGEALDAFNFLNESSNRTASSFLSSILDNTSEVLTPTTPVTPTAPEEKSDNDDVPLVHSVSFYRKKKKEQKFFGESTILGQFTTSPPQGASASAEPTSPVKNLSDGERFAREKARLEKEILIQEEQVLQASKAFTHCRKNLEFRGSRMEVDAQRALLIATERRRALIYVLDNLLQHYSRGTFGRESDKPRGTLTIKDISLRLMRDFVNGHINYHSDHMLYYFIVLIRHEETVHHTAMVTSDEGLQSGYLSFPNYIQLKSLPHDFNCTIEVYALRTKREIIGHTSTLKKPSKLQSFHQGFSSPGTPSAVIDPSFQKIGRLTLNIGNISKSKFHLTDVMSPLDGAVTLTLTCFPEETGTIGHKGFLSLYQEVDGIASWTRFWCVLNDGNLRFWKYPEDETTKKPVVIINLRDSACDEIRSIPVESCPYPNSMTIDIWIESMEKKGKHEKIRIMMAADTKEEMHRWLTVLNGSLRNITLWYPKH